MNDLRYVTKVVMNERKDVLLSILMGFLTGVTAVGLFASSGYLISKAALLPPIVTLSIMLALLKVFSLTRAGSRYGERIFSHRATFTILSNLRVDFFNRIEPLAPGIFQKYRSGDLLSRIVGDVESLQNYFLRVFYPPVVLVLVFLSTILFTAFFSIWLALVFLIGLIVTGFLIPAFFAWRQRATHRRVREGRGQLSTEVTELFFGFRDLKLYQQLESKEAALIQASREYADEQEREGTQSMVNLSVNTMATLLVSWVVIGLGAYLVTQGQLDGLFLAMMVMISLTVFENATPMAVLPIHFEDSRRAAKRLYDVVSDEVVKPDGTAELPAGEALPIRLSNVTHTFGGELRPALNDVSLELPAGSKTAIVGPSGSGKSTLLQVMLGILRPQEGSVEVSGVAVSGIEQERLWARMNVILQENHYFYGTVRENLLIADEDAPDELLRDVLDRVQLDGLSLDERVLERGDNLSGGEKQRLAMARVLLKGARVWLFDEPTSSIDALTEQRLYGELFGAAADDTVVLVSHRLTGLEKMDRIVVMEYGRVIEQGSYDELMAARGYFYELKQIERVVMEG